MKIVMHYNPALPHQVRHAEAFAKVGIRVSPRIDLEADVHVVSGPHYALGRWRYHPRVLWLDRALWGDPEYVSIGWLNPDGSRTFASGKTPRDRPATLDWKTRECSCLLLADYGQDVTELAAQARKRFGYVRIRRHPQDEQHPLRLETMIGLSDVCVGTSSTAMVDAVVMGVPTICLDPVSPLRPVTAHSMDAELYRGDREQWLHDMSYAQFNHDEFGLALELLNVTLPS